MSEQSQHRPPSNADFSRGNMYKSGAARSREYEGSSSVVTLFFVKKSLTKTDRCAGAFSWKRNHVSVLNFSELCLLTASLRRRKTSIHISLSSETIPANFENFLKLLLSSSSFRILGDTLVRNDKRVTHKAHSLQVKRWGDTWISQCSDILKFLNSDFRLKSCLITLPSQQIRRAVGEKIGDNYFKFYHFNSKDL